MQRRKRQLWLVFLVLQAVMLAPIAMASSLGSLDAAGIECPTVTDLASTDSCPDCPGANCQTGTCSAPIGAFALPMGSPDVACFLTIEKTASPIFLFAGSRAEAPLHPPPIV